MNFDLYILKSDVSKMENGSLAIGYISVPEDEKHNYELFSKYAFQPAVQIDSNRFEVAFIME